METIRPLLFEVSAEVCFKMGGIHTVIRSKIPYTQRVWDGAYFLIGPYMPSWDYGGKMEFRDAGEMGVPAVSTAISHLIEKGLPVRTGCWKVEGHPLVILFDPFVSPPDFETYRGSYAARYNMEVPVEWHIDLYLRFGYYLELFFKELCAVTAGQPPLILIHFHEYMTTATIAAIRKLPVRILFTTHSTVLGRMLAESDKAFYPGMEKIDWRKAAGSLSDYHRFIMHMERAAVKDCHVFTAVSQVTARECLFFLDRAPDVITWNGLDTAEACGGWGRDKTAVKAAIDQVVRRHFSEDPLVNRQKVLYFFTAGRYEYINKGYDVVIKALARLNRWLSASGYGITVVTFFITNEPYSHGSSIRNKILHFKKRIWKGFAAGRSSIFLQATEKKVYECRLVRDLKKSRLGNRHSDRVKVVYLPQFLSKETGPFQIDYPDFIRGCDLGIFPSYYEPWGYTPVECIAAGIPAVTSNVSGFGSYISRQAGISGASGVFVIDRLKKAEKELFEVLKGMVTEQKDFTGSLQQITRMVDWDQMIAHYEAAYQKAME